MTSPKGSPIDIEKEIDRLSVVFGKETRMEIAQWARSISDRVESQTMARYEEKGMIGMLPKLYSPSSSGEKDK